MSTMLDTAALADPPAPPGADGEALLDAWRDACGDAVAAYRAWCSSSRYRAGEAFAVYTAAHDREAAAARCPGTLGADDAGLSANHRAGR